MAYHYPQRMMEDGAIQDLSPETNTSGSRRFQSGIPPRLAPRGAWRAKCMITSRSTMSRPPIPCSGAADAAGRPQMSQRILPSGPQFPRFHAAQDALVASIKGEPALVALVSESKWEAAGGGQSGRHPATGFLRPAFEDISQTMSAHPSHVPAARAIPFSLDLQLYRLFSMLSTISDAEQPNSLHHFTSPGHQVALRDERAPSASGESTDNAIWISDDDCSDTEDENNVEDHDLNRSQSGCTTPTTASVVDHLDSMCTKHSETESDAAVRMGATAVLSPARLERVRILSHESQMNLSTDPESNQQALRSMTCTPTRDITAGADTDSDTSSIAPEIQSSLGASDGELVTEATGATSEPDVMTDAPDVMTDAPATPSERTYGPIATTPEVMAQTPLHDSKVCLSAKRDDATPAARSSSPGMRLLPESRPDQGQDHRSCSPSDTEPDSSEAESGSLPGARMSPLFREGLSRRRFRRTSPHTHTTVQDKDSDADTESSDSEDRLDVQECIYVEEHCPLLSDASGDGSGDDSEELHGRKRRRVSLSPHASARSAPASARSSHQQRSTRRTAQLPSGRLTSVCGSESPAPSQTSPVPIDAGTFARFEEWPLRNVSLKRITEGDKTTFQLQFDWTPDPSQPHAGRSVSHAKEGRGPPKASLSGTRSSGGKWSLEEENKVRTMRQDGCSWAEIQRALPHRSQGTIQVRYSTKLKG
ncbi:hypothetical protein FMUND_13760 [Fusarium mundagurra]|uniref:Myb-like domain-containing protein n=1 Tax=Fusarium mundagurra TaxID=1567541 RepID=A0A8H5XYS3_9HYPO|nr:hypothetical protein FMUND_13760 [Fusarium mundagurra]